MAFSAFWRLPESLTLRGRTNGATLKCRWMLGGPAPRPQESWGASPPDRRIAGGPAPQTPRDIYGPKKGAAGFGCRLGGFLCG